MEEGRSGQIQQNRIGTPWEQFQGHSQAGSEYTGASGGSSNSARSQSMSTLSGHTNHRAGSSDALAHLRAPAVYMACSILICRVHAPQCLCARTCLCAYASVHMNMHACNQHTNRTYMKSCAPILGGVPATACIPFKFGSKRVFKEPAILGLSCLSCTCLRRCWNRYAVGDADTDMLSAMLMWICSW